MSQFSGWRILLHDGFQAERIPFTVSSLCQNNQENSTVSREPWEL